MVPRVCPRRQIAALFALLSMTVVSGCTSIGDFGRLQAPLVNDHIHDWVGVDAATAVGAPISINNLTDDERMLRDLAFPLIEPPYDRQRWDAVVYEYGIKHSIRRELWTFDVTAYYAHLEGTYYRSSEARYNQLIDDMRNDIVRIEPFFATARQVVDLDQRRVQAMQHVPDLNPTEHLSALARVGENSLTIAWVHRSLTERCASYHFALDHLTVAEPTALAADAALILTELQQQIAANQIVPAPHFAALPQQFAAIESPPTR